MVSAFIKKNLKFLELLIVFTFLFAVSPKITQAIENNEREYFYDSVVKGNLNPTITGIKTTGSDLIAIYVKQGTNPVKSIYAQNISNSSDAFTVKVSSSSASTYYLSLKNGTYKIALIDSSGRYVMFDKAIQMNNSCKNESNLNATGTGKVERCFKYDGSLKPDISGDIVRCAAGYVIDTAHSGEYSNNCYKLNSSSLTNYGVYSRYCSKTYVYSCVKESVETTSYLKNLSLSSGSLSPSFNPKTTTYSATVNASSVSINASLNSDGSSFVSGSGPRTVNLSYGSNTFSIKVKSSSGKITTYTIKITRQDQRSKVNTLSSLNVDGIKLNESFSASRTSYTASVSNDVTKAYVNAELTSSKSSFAKGYGPRSVSLVEGTNTIQLKVKSEAGTIKTYTIKIVRAGSGNPETPVQPPIDTEKLGLLKSLEIENVKLNFDPKVLEYNITVPYETTTLLITPVAENSADEITIKGHENLEVEDTNIVTIEVKTKENFTRVYTINVIRKGKDLEVSNDSSLKELNIKNHEIEFDPVIIEYEIILGKKETSLDIEAITNDPNATVEIFDNENLTKGSEVKIRVTAEDASTTEYIISILNVEKGTNIFLIIIIVIVLVLVIAYTILRILGYKIYFNFSMLGSMFRNFGNKNKDE